MTCELISNVPNVSLGGLINSEWFQVSLKVSACIPRLENTIPDIRFDGSINRQWTQESREKILSTGLMCSLG